MWSQTHAKNQKAMLPSLAWTWRQQTENDRSKASSRLSGHLYPSVCMKSGPTSVCQSTKRGFNMSSIVYVCSDPRTRNGLRGTVRKTVEGDRSYHDIVVTMPSNDGKDRRLMHKRSDRGKSWAERMSKVDAESRTARHLQSFKPTDNQNQHNQGKTNNPGDQKIGPPMRIRKDSVSPPLSKERNSGDRAGNRSSIPTGTVDPNNRNQKLHGTRRIWKLPRQESQSLHSRPQSIKRAPSHRSPIQPSSKIPQKHHQRTQDTRHTKSKQEKAISLPIRTYLEPSRRGSDSSQSSDSFPKQVRFSKNVEIFIT